MNEFEKTFDSMVKKHDPATLFDDFLDFGMDNFLINPNKKYFNYNKYDKEEHHKFYVLFHCWVHSTKDKLEHGYEWFDFLGTFYENTILSKYKAGKKKQFFTPPQVCNVLDEIVNRKANDNPDVMNGTAYDPCCGSGRLLLGWHILKPRDVCFAQDVDLTACKMTVLNFLIHGVKGSVSHMDSITQEWFNGWKVNECIDMDELAIMECDSYNETLCFIGHEWSKTTESRKTTLDGWV